jgi:hypothetical protein
MFFNRTGTSIFVNHNDNRFFFLCQTKTNITMIKRIPIIIACMLLFASMQAFATIYNVGDTTELTAALTGSSAGDTIQFTADLTLPTVYGSSSNASHIQISQSLFIDGNGHTVSGSSNRRIFRVEGTGNSHVIIHNLKIKNGNCGYPAGGIINVGTAATDTVSVINCTLTGNVANGSNGGAVVNHTTGVVIINNCTLVGNAATGSGGAVANTSTGSVFIINSTISGNKCGGSGGGVYNAGTGTVAILNSIVLGNYKGSDPTANNVADDIGGSAGATYNVIYSVYGKTSSTFSGISNTVSDIDTVFRAKWEGTGPYFMKDTVADAPVFKDSTYMLIRRGSRADTVGTITGRIGTDFYYKSSPSGTSWTKLGGGSNDNVELIFDKGQNGVNRTRGTNPYIPYAAGAYVPSPQSNDAKLSSLTVVNTGTPISGLNLPLTPEFNSTTTDYAVTVSYYDTHVTITPTKNHSEAKLSGTYGTVDTPVEYNGVASDKIYSIIVTAEDGTEKIYKVTVKRVAASLLNKNLLDTITVNSSIYNEVLPYYPLSPGFTKGTGATQLNYTVSVPASDTAVYINVRPESGTTGHVGGRSLTGSTTIFKITRGTYPAQVVYNITVNRNAANTNADLGSLTVSGGTLTPVFHKDTLGYTVNVPYETDSITITGAAASAQATVTGNGKKGLLTGNNTYNIVVTAQNGTTTKTYRVTVIRAASSLSGDPRLKALAVTPGTLTPAFHADTVKYTVNVPYGTKTVRIAAEGQVYGAEIAGLGENLPLQEGANVFNLIVISANRLYMKTYAITVNVPDTDANATVSGTRHTVWSSDGRLYVDAKKAVRLQVYSIAGALLLQENIPEGITGKDLSQGVYVVVVDGVSEKITVR